VWVARLPAALVSRVQLFRGDYTSHKPDWHGTRGFSRVGMGEWRNAAEATCTLISVWFRGPYTSYRIT
jgi:hypothetical protein